MGETQASGRCERKTRVEAAEPWVRQRREDPVRRAEGRRVDEMVDRS